jgi:hypothetical protein
LNRNLKFMRMFSIGSDVDWNLSWSIARTSSDRQSHFQVLKSEIQYTHGHLLNTIVSSVAPYHLRAAGSNICSC